LPPSLPNLHPLLIHFPIALFTFGLGLDVALVAYWRSAWLDRAATLVQVAGALSSAVAAASGKLAANAIELALAPEAQERLGLHSDWAFFAVVLLFVAAGLRFDASWRDRAESAPRLHRGRRLALAAGLVAAAALLWTASYGGALVYLSGVGVKAPGP
jgi:uncharacterized membrane protein